MREYLFRGKTKEGIWFEGSLHQYTIVTPSKTEKHYKIQEFNYGYQDEAQFDCDYMCGFDEEVIPETVGQYVGLKDKNGKKVFEGDIVEFLDRDKFKWKGVVVYQKEYALYLVKANSVKPFWAFWFVDMDIERVEVIGNVIDNKELLGE